MRRGLGKGMGRGYYNLTPMDSHIHGLSAQGVSTIPKYAQDMAKGTLFVAERIPSIQGVPIGAVVKIAEYIPLSTPYMLKRMSEGKRPLFAKGVKTYQKELLKKGIEIRREPHDRFRYGTLDVDFEYDDETNKVINFIPIIVLFGSKKQEDITTIKHELIHIKQMEKVLFEPLRKKIKQGISLDSVERFVDKILPKLNHNELEREAEVGENK